MPTAAGSSGVATNAAKRVPSADSSVMSSWETAAPEMTGIGGSESSSKHIRDGLYGRSGGLRGVQRFRRWRSSRIARR